MIPAVIAAVVTFLFGYGLGVWRFERKADYHYRTGKRHSREQTIREIEGGYFLHTPVSDDLRDIMRVMRGEG